MAEKSSTSIRTPTTVPKAAWIFSFCWIALNPLFVGPAFCDEKRLSFDSEIAGENFAVHGPVYSATVGEYRLSGGVLINLSASIPLTSASDIQVSLTGIEIEHPIFETSDLSLNIEGYLSKSSLAIERFDISAASASVRTATGEWLPLQSVNIEGKGWGGLDEGEPFQGILTVSARDIPSVTFDVQASLKPSPFLELTGHIAPIDLGAAHSALGDRLPFGLKDWMVQGNTNNELALKVAQSGRQIIVDATFNYSFTNLSLFSPDAMTALSEIDFDLTGNVSAEFVSPSASEERSTFEIPELRNIKLLEWDIDSSLKGQEFFYDVYYHSLKNAPVNINTSGRWIVEQNRAENLHFNLSSPAFGSVEMTGSAEQLGSTPYLRAHVSSHNLDSASFIHSLIEEGVLNSFVPAVSNWQASGTTSLDIDLRGTMDDWQTWGQVNFVDGILEKKEGFRVGVIGCNVDMPFYLSSAEGPAPEKVQPEAAKLSWENVVLGPIVLPSESTRFELFGQTLNLKQPISLAVSDGMVSIVDFQMDKIISDDFNMLLEGAVSGVRLGPLARDFGLPDLSGRITAERILLEKKGADLVSRGSIAAKVFDGTIEFSNVRIEDFMEDDRRFQLAAEFQSIDLRPLTDFLQYGGASGIIKGSVENLVFDSEGVYQFDFQVESVPTSGVPQRISTELVLIIAESGSEFQAPNALLREYEDFAYKKMGLRARLKDGRLYLEGTAGGEKENYFLTRGLFGGIDMPIFIGEQGTDFEEFVNRLRQAAQSARVETE